MEIFFAGFLFIVLIWIVIKGIVIPLDEILEILKKRKK